MAYMPHTTQMLDAMRAAAACAILDDGQPIQTSVGLCTYVHAVDRMRILYIPVPHEDPQNIVLLLVQTLNCEQIPYRWDDVAILANSGHTLRVLSLLRPGGMLSEDRLLHDYYTIFYPHVEEWLAAREADIVYGV